MTLGCTASQILGQVAPIVRNKATQIIKKGISCFVLGLVLRCSMGSEFRAQADASHDRSVCLCFTISQLMLWQGWLREVLEAMLHVAVCLAKPSTLNSAGSATCVLT